MFTGIIQEIGEVLRTWRQGESLRLMVGCEVVRKDLRVGDSICVSGTCLTVTRLNDRAFEADLSSETQKRTTLGSLQAGSKVNLELPLQPQSRLGGHLVNGHVDGVGEVIRLPAGGVGEWTFTLPESLERYVVEKGCIAVDGISLTVAAVSPGQFSVAIIPSTLRLTNLSAKRFGDPVNLEVDVLAKYVEKLLSARGDLHRQDSLLRTLEEYEYLR